MDSSEADWAATFWLMSEPKMAQVARKRVTEKSARRVRGAIGVDLPLVCYEVVHLKAASKYANGGGDRCPPQHHSTLDGVYTGR